MKRNLLIAIIIGVTLLAGCAGKRDFRRENPEAAFRNLTELYNKGKYTTAAEGLDFFTLNYSGSAKVDSAQYLLGQCFFHMKDYLIAAASFEELARRFPTSHLVPDAMFMVGVCYWELSPKYSLDQEYTLKSIDAFQTFIDYYPERAEQIKESQVYIDNCRQKLGKKEYENGVIYLKMKDWTSALIYFQNVLDLYYDTEWAPKAAYQKAVVEQRAELFDEAIAAYGVFIDKYPQHQWVDKARNGIAESREAMLEADQDYRNSEFYEE